jgi:hypothetical protein
MFIITARWKRRERMKREAMGASLANPQFQDISAAAGQSLTGVSDWPERSPCGYLSGKTITRIQREEPQTEDRPFSGVF